MRFVRSIRFRLTVLYSILLFVLAGGGLLVTYIAVERTTDPQAITKRYEAELIKRRADGTEIPLGTMEVASVQEIESEITLRTLNAMRTYSGYALGGLFVASLGIGWILSGRALRPARSIARAAQDIQATDLSRRINLGGTKDELRELADTIDAMLDRLDGAFRAQRQLIDDASHELRTPLAVIRAHLDASLKSTQASPAEQTRAVEVIDRATSRMSRLVEDLLATARRDAGSLADADVDLGAIAFEAGEEFAVLAAEKQLRLDYRVQPSLSMIGDHDGLRRAVGNLLSNAIRLSPAGAPITIGAGHSSSWLWIAVADNGPGIAGEDQSRVFDRFWRGPQNGDGRTGLGLAIVRQIVESHGGRVAVFSRLGRGSTFVLWFVVPGAAPDSGPPTSNPL
ncbi:sensor histidine kinase [Kibdelosporangium aridum]|uniref:histidine kinase n=1 Tax=Kibdelosporangium aridum TaxID=2030 RepID=A0A428ZFB1_KIBAR|nr:HAMP domain-containing sensor histidine kinase [Kibdelosporangium aridum]RSM86661.1 sensor histidine kinase [Kibdelosporangium aridum]